MPFTILRKYSFISIPKWELNFMEWSWHCLRWNNFLFWPILNYLVLFCVKAFTLQPSDISITECDHCERVDTFPHFNILLFISVLCEGGAESYSLVLLMPFFHKLTYMYFNNIRKAQWTMYISVVFISRI